MELIISDTLKFAIALLSIINPIGAIPIFLAMTKDNSEKEIRKISSSCSVAIAITIIISLILGQKILSVFGISINSFRIGGGLLLFTMAFSMISAKNPRSKITTQEIEEHDPNEIGIVPLAIPLLAGPGTISTCIIKAQEIHGTGTWVGVFVSVILIAIFIKIVLLFSRKIGTKLGTLGLNVMTRIMGLILVALSVEFIVGGLKGMFPTLN